ncbi:MAG: DUF5655 domain-containing protein, partial [Promethearchaeota archaeon]
SSVNFLIDNGLLHGRENFELSYPDNTDTFSKIYSGLIDLWFRYKSSSISYTEFILKLISKQNCQIERHNSSIYFISKSDNPSLKKAVLIVVDEYLGEKDPGLFSFLITSLSYFANHFSLRYGIIAQNKKMIIYDFSDKEFKKKNLIFNLEEIFNDNLEDKYFTFKLVFSCIYSYDPGDREISKRKIMNSSSKSGGVVIKNRLLYRNDELITNLMKKLESRILNLSENVRFVENKMYTSFIYNNKKFCEVHMQKSQIKIWIPLTINEIHNPQVQIKDVREIGHYGTGATEFFLKNENQIDDVINIINQSFQHV